MPCLVTAACARAQSPHPAVPLGADRNMCVAGLHLSLQLALPSMCALATIAFPTFDADLLEAVPPTLARLTLQADTLLFAFFDRFLTSRPQVVYLALPNSVGVPLGAGEAPPLCLISLQAGREPGYPCGNELTLEAVVVAIVRVIYIQHRNTDWQLVMHCLVFTHVLLYFCATEKYLAVLVTSLTLSAYPVYPRTARHMTHIA